MAGICITSILFAKPQSALTLEFKRANHILKRSMSVRSRMGGGYRSDFFLIEKISNFL